jgi:hypothetical protein
MITPSPHCVFTLFLCAEHACNAKKMQQAELIIVVPLGIMCDNYTTSKETII